MRVATYLLDFRLRVKRCQMEVFVTRRAIKRVCVPFERGNELRPRKAYTR